MNERQELIDCTKTWIDLAGEVYGREFRMPHVSIDLSGVCAGRACYANWTVKFNLELYRRNKDDFSNRTVPHEVAHLIAYTLNGGMRPKPHGYEWQSVMRKLGIKDITRCHSYDVAGLINRRPRPYVYACGCTEHHVTSNIHSKIQAGQERVCRKCRQRIKLVRTEAA